MKHLKTMLLVLLTVGLIYQQKLLHETTGFLDIVYTAFVTCVSTKAQIIGIDPV